MIEKLGGRKFVFGMMLIVLSFVLVCVGKLETEIWTQFVSIVGGTYVLGNVASRITDKTRLG